MAGGDQDGRGGLGRREGGPGWARRAGTEGGGSSDSPTRSLQISTADVKLHLRTYKV